MSPKNKGSFGKGKAVNIPETDEFISGVNRVLRAVKPHATSLAIFFGVVAVIVVGFSVYQWWGQRKASGATQLYARAVALGQVQVADQAPEDQSKLPPDPRDLPTHFVNRTERAKAVLAAVEELQAEFGSTEIAQQADVLAADQLYQLGKFSEAGDRYRAYADHGGPPSIVLAAREGYAYTLEATADAAKDPVQRQAGLEKALSAFEAMQPSAQGELRDEALFHQARVLAELGRTDDAVKRFEQVLTDHPESGLKQDVELRLIALNPHSGAKTAPAAAGPE